MNSVFTNSPTCWNFTVAPKSVLAVFIWSLGDIGSHLRHMGPAEVEQGDILPSCSRSHSVSKCPFCGLFSTTIVKHLCFWGVSLLFKISPCPGLLCCWAFPKCNKKETCLGGKLCSGGVLLLVMSSTLKEQQCIWNKAALNRNTHKTKLCTDWWMKMWRLLLQSIPCLACATVATTALARSSKPQWESKDKEENAFSRTHGTHAEERTYGH